MTDARPSAPLDEDLEWCYDAVSDVSRTFALTIEALEEPMASRICVGYLLCRVADTIEDAGHLPPDVQQELLDQYAAVLARPDADGRSDPPTSVTAAASFQTRVEEWLPRQPEERADDWRVVENAPLIVRTFEGLPAADREAIRGPVRELVGGMATFVDRYAEIGGLRIATIEELEEYCWYAAGTVGELITNLLVRDADPERARTLEANARSFALLLQLVNVAKDVSDDYRTENNVYLPARWLREVGVEQDRVTAPENAEEVAMVVERLADRAAGYLDDAQAYLEALPEQRGNTLAAWAIPFLLAVGTIRELRERPADVVREGELKVPKAEVIALLARTEGGIEPDAIGPLRERIVSQPLHRAD